MERRETSEGTDKLSCLSLCLRPFGVRRLLPLILLLLLFLFLVEHWCLLRVQRLRLMNESLGSTSRMSESLGSTSPRLCWSSTLSRGGDRPSRRSTHLRRKNDHLRRRSDHLRGRSSRLRRKSSRLRHKTNLDPNEIFWE